REPAPRLESHTAAPARGRQAIACLVDDGEWNMAKLPVHGVAEHEEVDERKDHRRDDQNRLSPESQVSALTDRRDAQEDPKQGTDAPRSLLVCHASRRPRPVYEKKTSSSVTGAIVR